MPRRLSLAGQLLALQVVIICVVLVGVAAVTVAQSTKRAQDTEGRRALAVAETLANARIFREAVAEGGEAYIRVAAESTRSVSGSASVVVALADRTVIASADPDQLGTRFPMGDSTVLEGRAWVGERELDGDPAAVAMVPVLTGPERESAGFVAVTRRYPSVMDGLAAAAPNLLTYLGLASAIGIVGSLLVARRVKRQTLGLEPAEITGLVEHRDAMLHGIREGVVGLDLRGRVTLISDEAIRLLRIPGDALGRTLEDLGVGEEMRDALLSGEVERDRAVASAGRVLVVNRLPIASRGRPIGSVTTLRDRTELLELRRELDLTQHVTDTLRAQAHEFSNRLHTIAGLIELGEADEAVRFVHRISSSRSELIGAVTGAVLDSSVAALLIAKASQAAELGVELRIAPDSALPVLDGELSADVATVVGNLVDNAMDAAAASPQQWVEVSLGVVDGEVEVVVQDSGPGVPPGMEREVFRRGVSTKSASLRTGPADPDQLSKERGIGLALVHLVCTRRGGEVTASSDDISTFTARLPVESAVMSS
ncbi:sensor histidine kinase [Blastococcus saxobsidens]|uniref:Two component signal transduction histidine kinase regulating citrate/malate metabolism n=1 Tax=Blastococcus saxobsidens (strain DD2) TaxID=1146883 RepID=H6RS47_BLASD|nr:ATP-binding protein [Blastococcus saxobsidens]CCG04241.1 Two component signal transduction histidine kinase regulating citrate/malate metabolism [Blastococcus saxobsidens DD2]